jgi:hypothetical protein
MFVCKFILCLSSCVYVAALRRADHSSKESYSLCKKICETEEEEEASAQQRAVVPLMNEILLLSLYCIICLSSLLTFDARNKSEQER